MDLKDWKKIKVSISSEKNYGWKGTEGNETIRLYMNKTKISPFEKSRIRNTLYFDTKDSNRQHIFMKQYQAINHAKNYMRSH